MISKKYFLADGSTTNFLSDYIIKNDEYCRVYVSDSYELPVSAAERAALLANVSQWELVNNNIVFYEAPAAGKYVTVWVASTPEELDTYIDYAFITYDNIANIETVVDNMDSITTVAGDTTDINTIITNLADINAVAAIDSAVTAVSDISTEVVAVAGIKQEIINVDSNSADISTVATYNSDVSIVSGNIGAVQTVSSNNTNINTVATNIADVATVAANVTDVTNFADVYYGPSATAPTTRRDGSALQAGDLWFDTANGYIKVYTGTDWLQASVQGASREVVTATEGQTSVLVSSGYNVDQIDVYLNGQKMITGSDFTAIDGQYVTFLYGLQAGDKVEVISMASIATDEANLIQRVTFTADGATATFDTTHTLVSKSSIMVSVNGVVQNATAFSVSGTTFTMNELPEDGDVLDVMVFGVSPTSIIQQAESIIYTPVGETSTNVQAHLEDVDANKQDRVYTPSGTGAVARTVESKLGETVSVKDFGAVGDGVTDDTAAIQAAITARAGQKIYFPKGTYLTSDEIVLDSEGTELIGDGVGSLFDGTLGASTIIKGTHTTKSVIRIQIESCKITDMVIDASTSRNSASRDNTASGFNCGIRVEAEDVAAPEGDVFNTCLNRVHIINQPNDGLIWVGRCYESYMQTVVCESNKGHGCVVTNGEHTNRTNTAIAGALTFSDCAWKKNDGHGLRVGQANTTDYAFRITLNNSEGLNNDGTNGADLEDPADSFIHCDGFTIINGAATGTDKAGTSQANAGYTFGGQGGVVIDARILDTDEPIRIFDFGRGTSGWNIINPHIRTTGSAYIVQIGSGVENINIWAGDNIGALTQASNVTGVVGLSAFIAGTYTTNRTEKFLGSLKDANNLELGSVKLNNQNITTTPATILDASTVGKMWEISIMHTGDPCISSATCTVVGGSTPVVSNVQNQSGAGVTYAVTVSGTNIQLATSAGTRNSDIFIKEKITA